MGVDCMWRLIDLSLPIMEGSGEPMPARVRRLGHRPGAAHIAAKLEKAGFLPRGEGFAPSDLPDGEFLSNEELTLSVHTATHFDAPFHFGSVCRGAPARTVDEVPLEWCLGPGVVLDVSHRGPGEEITVEDFETAAAGAATPPAAGVIVLIRTGCDRLWGTPAYATDHPGVSPEALVWLLDAGVRVVGIDACGFDRPTRAMTADYLRTRDPGCLWPVHLLGRRREYCHIERLANLDHIPPGRTFDVACFPVKIAGAGAAWVRAVAIVAES